MAVNISAWSIRQPLPSVVFSIILLILGWMSFTKLAGHAAAERRHSRHLRRSGAIRRSAGGTEVAGHQDHRGRRFRRRERPPYLLQITDGLSITMIEFQLETNTDRALNDIKDAVTRVRSNLPQNVNEPLIQRVDVVGLPILTYAAIAPGKTPEQLSWFVDDVVKRALQGIRGVAQVERIGGVEREILVSLDPDRLTAVGLTALDVSRRLRGSNVDLAGGRAEIGRNDQAIRTLAGARTLNDLAGTMISLPNGGEVRLDDLGAVTDTVADRRTFARFNGEPVVALGIRRSKGASDVIVARKVEERIEELKKANPEVDLQLIDTSVEFTKGNYEAAIHTLFEGAALAVIIVFLFLRDLRATIIAAISLPLSIFPAFWVMDLLGFSLNMVSFLAITLSTGILVDDAIVEIENIVRHMRMGKSPYRASLEAADEIGLAVIAISLTIIAIFAPASFMPGIAGQFFKQFGITVSVQVFFSLVAARMVTPVLAAYFLKPHHHDDPPPGFVLRGYNHLVKWCVRHYYLTVIAGLGVFALSILSITLLPQGIPAGAGYAALAACARITAGRAVVLYGEDDRGDRDAPAQAARGEERICGRRPGAAGDQRGAPRRADHQLHAEGRSRHHPARTRTGDRQGPRERSRHSLLVPRRQRPARALADRHGSRDRHRQPGCERTRPANAADIVDRQRHLRNGTGSARIAHPAPRRSRGTARRFHRGPIGNHPRRNDRRRRSGAGKVRRRRPANSDPRAVRRKCALQPERCSSSCACRWAADAAACRCRSSPIYNSIRDRPASTATIATRQATVAADLVGKAALGDAMVKIERTAGDEKPAEGRQRSVNRATPKACRNLSDGFATCLGAGLMMVYAVLVLLFGTFLQPITILFSLPLSIGGAILALVLTGNMQLTIPVWIGIIMLMGIVTKNAIMLVDFAMESMLRRHEEG